MKKSGKRNNTLSQKHCLLLIGVVIAVFYIIRVPDSFACIPYSISSTNEITHARNTPSHPYLFFTTERIKVLKNRINNNPDIHKVWENMLAKADQAETNNNQRLGMIKLYGLAYRMTGENKYAAIVKKILTHEISLKSWGDRQLLNRNPPWHAGLGLAARTQSVAVGYDCIYDYLSKEDRQRIAKGITHLGILPTLDDWVLGDKRIHALDSMGHNWWSACVFQAGIAALAVMNEVPQARGWVNTISNSALQWFYYNGNVLQNKPRTIGKDGGYYESVNYAAFAMSEYLFFRVAWMNAFPNQKPPKIPLLPKIADYFINSSYPNSMGPLQSVNFGDTNIYSNGERPIKLLIALGYHKKRYLWYINQIQQGQMREGLDRDTPMGLVYDPSNFMSTTAPEHPDLPESKIYKGIGWAMLRNSWNKDATMLAVKCGETWNHAHADAGSFILFHNGQNLLINSGDCYYGDPMYTGYYTRSMANNVVLFNGYAQDTTDQYYGVHTEGKLHHLMDSNGLKDVFADATGPTSHYFMRNYRHFLWIGNVILIIDDVKAYKPGKFEWLLHYNGKQNMKD